MQATEVATDESSARERPLPVPAPHAGAARKQDASCGMPVSPVVLFQGPDRGLPPLRIRLGPDGRSAGSRQAG